MEPSLKALLARAIDYAGMFPPAELPLGAAIEQYLSHMTGVEAWMVGQFIVPAGRSDELEPYRSALQRTRSAGLIVLGRTVEKERWWTTFASDLADFAATRQRWVGVLEIAALETRVPSSLVREPRFAERLADQLRTIAPPCDLYLEVTNDLATEAGWLDPIATLAMARHAALLPTVGYKFRCGGTTAAAHPPVSRLAAVLTHCQQQAIPLKGTAGLHHPLRAYQPLVETKQHGFINLSMAAALLHAQKIDSNLLEQLLAEEAPEAFHAEGDGLAWRGLRLTTPEIQAARRERWLGFGSCSVTEPCEDLRALGWL